MIRGLKVWELEEVFTSQALGANGGLACQTQVMNILIVEDLEISSCFILWHIILACLYWHVRKRIMSPAEVGPVEKVIISEGFAQISFGAAKHAFSAVQKYDGSVLARC